MHVYDDQVAVHYAAYRPPLHDVILSEALGEQRFASGLDLGCGTGRSTVALAKYCDTSIGVDLSLEMLASADRDSDVTYILAGACDLPLRDASVDLVTLAGVLPYLDRPLLVREMTRIARRNAILLAYDFDVDLTDLMQLFSLPKAVSEGTYDHALNLSGCSAVSTIRVLSRRIEIPANEAQAAHVLLSDSERHEMLADHFGDSDPFAGVVSRVRETGWAGRLSVTLYHSLHQLDAKLSEGP